MSGRRSSRSHGTRQGGNLGSNPTTQDPEGKVKDFDTALSAVRVH